MVLLDVSIVNVALPSIRAGLHAQQSELQWVVSGYALTFGLLLVPAGRLGDAAWPPDDVRGRTRRVHPGQRWPAAPRQSSLWLVIARLVQGSGGRHC